MGSTGSQRIGVLPATVPARPAPPEELVRDGHGPALRDATPVEVDGWDGLVAANPDGGHFLQTRAWAEFKAAFGWRPRYLVGEGIGGTVATLFLCRWIPGLGEVWYAPKGPGVGSRDELIGLLGNCSAFGRAFLVKVEPELPAATFARADSGGVGLRRADADVQINRATIVIDLGGTEEQLLGSFHQKLRYNIRLAARKGVTVEAADTTPESLERMWELLATTARRAGFALRSRQYFQTYWRRLSDAGQGQLFFARHRDEDLAGAFLAYMGAKAWYKDGGSTGRHTDMMAPHLLQWEIMRWLRNRGVRSYDLFAVPPVRELSSAHPFYGLYRFKSGFSRTITEYVGTLDLPLKPARYRLWTLFAERLATTYRARVHGDSLLLTRGSAAGLGV